MALGAAKIQERPACLSNNYNFFLSFFNGHIHKTWKFPCQGLNPSRSGLL